MIVVIINPIAGGCRADEARRRAALASALLSHAGEPAEVFVTERKGHARELAASAVARGARLVIAWGGDGTINETASALVFRVAALGIVPAGSGNGLAAALGVSTRPERAIGDAVHARPRAIDAGELGGRLFFSVAGVGLDAHIASCFDRQTSRRRGFITYARITAREFLAYQPAAYRLDCSPSQDAGAAIAAVAMPTRALLVTLANGSQWGNGAFVAPFARLDDGRLDLVVVEERSRIASIWALPRIFTGGIARLRGVKTQRVEQATIDSDAPMTFHVDGEPVEDGTHLEARVHPLALRVAVR